MVDNTDKEIHLDFNHILNTDASLRAQEIKGVLVHEMVHCFQHNGRSTAPGGLIEGIADWVRLRSSLDPPHWSSRKPAKGTRWDAGYERTAFFLDFLCHRYGGDQVVRDLNLELSDKEWGNEIWERVLGEKKEVEGLWEEYLKSFEESEKGAAEVALPTHTPAPKKE
ncbi:plant basic secretory protein [Atractiella rhizophila]|nr:plant basic secretory protein [Atractiella rhizophila]KAH8925076.1 plant basic secretory protein [Atractiella rhizophila]